MNRSTIASFPIGSRLSPNSPKLILGSSNIVPVSQNKATHPPPSASVKNQLSANCRLYTYNSFKHDQENVISAAIIYFKAFAASWYKRALHAGYFDFFESIS